MRISDWSSDVCSSERYCAETPRKPQHGSRHAGNIQPQGDAINQNKSDIIALQSEKTARGYGEQRSRKRSGNSSGYIQGQAEGIKTSQVFPIIGLVQFGGIFDERQIGRAHV